MTRPTRTPKRFAQKHGAGAPLSPALRDIVVHKADGGRLSCAVAFKIAIAHHLSPIEVGRAADLLELRLVKCQLGLFGYGPGKNVLTPVRSVPEPLKKAIFQGITDGRLPCKRAWEIAKAHDLHKFKIAAACNALDVKIGPCQLGAF
ncbi:MAG: hypothetical protein JRI36_02800 [Deltaproteobacteria bacterium]|nr:hypothetical protein [Deltaproteobacteria bacterium]